MAEQEREAISQRTKAALAAAKARGAKLGNPKGVKVPNATLGRARGVAAIKANARAFAERIEPVLAELGGLSARGRSSSAEATPPPAAANGRRPWSCEPARDSECATKRL